MWFSTRDPLGPFAFAMALHPILLDIQEQVPSLIINAWYLDDGVLCGSADDILCALSTGPSCGLFLNRSKCLIYCSNELLPDSILQDAHGGFSLLGAPIGPSLRLLQSVCFK